MNKILHKWMKIVSHNPLATYLFFMTLSITIGVVFYFWKGVTTQNAMAEQLLHRQQIIARAGALSTSSFLNNLGRVVAVHASRSVFLSESTDAKNADLRSFMSEWMDTPVNGIIMVNSSGIAVASSNRVLDPKNPTNFADRKFFTWAKLNAMPGQYYIGEPVIARIGLLTGKYIVPVASPVFDKNGDFKGVLVASVSVDKLVSTFANPLKISENTMIFVVDDNANFIFSSVPSLTGKSITSVFEGVNFPGKDSAITLIYKHLPNGDEGKLDLTLPNIYQDKKMTRYLVAYSKLNLDQNKWSFAVVSPADEAFLFTGPFYKDQIVSLVYLIVVVVGFSIIGITSARLRN